MEKIIFYTFDDNEVKNIVKINIQSKVELTKDMTLKSVIEILKNKEDMVKIHFSYNNINNE